MAEPNQVHAQNLVYLIIIVVKQADIIVLKKNIFYVIAKNVMKDVDYTLVMFLSCSR